MKHKIPHDLDHSLARLATRRALDAYRERFPELRPDGEWLDDDRARIWFSPPGRRLEGRVHVQAHAIELELDVPLLFRPFRKKAISIIEAEVRAWIDRAKAGELS